MKKLILILLIFSSISLYSEDFWECLYGPNSGGVNSIGINPVNGNFFITSLNGIFRSSDNGKNWVHIFKNYNPSLTISRKGKLFARYSENSKINIFLSEDNGNTWKQITINNCLGMLYFDENDVMYTCCFNYPDTIITAFSYDYGKSWYDNIFQYFIPENYHGWSGRFIKSASKLAFWGHYIINIGDPIYPGFVFLSNDTGKTWEKHEGLPAVKCLEFLSNGHILAGTSNGLYISVDGGISWFNWIFTNIINNIFQDKDNRIYLSYTDGLYSSYDNGTSWNHISKIGFSSMISDSHDVLYGSQFVSGFYYSTNKGIDWIQSNHGFTADDVKAIAYDKEGNIYTVSYGVYKSTDNGNSWDCIGLRDKYLTTIAINENDEIFTASNYFAYGVFRSTDNGKTWEQFTEGLIISTGRPVGAETLFINKRGHIFLGSEFPGYWSSIDNGVTWQRVYEKGGALRFAFNSEGNILRGGSSDGIFFSSDDGDTWSNEYPMPYGSVVRIFFNSRNSNGYGILGGSGYDNGMFLKTTNNGDWWGELERDKIKCGIHAIDSSDHLLQHCGDKVWRSVNDNEYEWEDISSGLFHDKFNFISVAPNGYIFLAAENGGLYRSKQKYVSVRDNPIHSDNLFLGSSPNPFSESTTIKYSLPSPTHVKLSIYDIFGREVAVLVEGWQDIGEHIYHLPFTIYHLSDGIYFCKLQAGGETKVIKILKIE